MATCIPFQTQLTSIMEVLVKTAVSEISKLVDDKCGSLHIEISRTQSENEILKRKLLVMENQKAQMHRGFESYIDSGTDAGSSCPHPAGNIKFANADQDAAAFAIKEETPDEAVWRRRSSDSIGHAMRYSNPSAEAHPLDEPGGQLSNAEFTNEGTPSNHFHAVSRHPGLRGEETHSDLQLTIKMEKEEEEGHPAGSGRERCQHGGSAGKQNPPPPPLPGGGGGGFSLDDRENQLWSSIIEGNDIDAGFLDFSSVVEEYSSAFPSHPDNTHAFPGGHCKAGAAGPPSSAAAAPKPPCKAPYGGEYQKDVAAAAFQIPGRAHPAHEPSERDADPDRPAFSPDGFPPPHHHHHHQHHQHHQQNPPPAGGAAGAAHHHRAGSAASAAGGATRGYICSLCGKAFARLHQFKLHQQSHKRRRAFWCGVCGKSFQCSSHLNIHHRTHTGEKPYGCGQCGKRFTQQSSLRVHQRTHSGERPYGCAQCGKTFILLHHLKRHRIIHAYS
ncbi:unnamed protein product [Boreogadus saida]